VSNSSRVKSVIVRKSRPFMSSVTTIYNHMTIYNLSLFKLTKTVIINFMLPRDIFGSFSPASLIIQICY
ncbi:MAG: hypothetical protein ACTSR4_06130, partial [Candidatus Hodarchaeales archaeon]